MPNRVYLGRLPMDARERDIEHFFKGFGHIRSILIKENYAFIEFENYRDADDAVYELNGKVLCGDRVIVEHSRESSNRGYGGGGGRNNRNFGRSGGGRSFGGGGGGRDFGSFGTDLRGSRNRNDGYNRNNGVSGRNAERTKYRVVVENLSTRCSWQDLKDFMRTAGDVRFADAHRIREGEGVVEFSSEKDMNNAISKLNGSDLKGRKIKLIAPKTNRSRSYSRSRSNSSRSRSRTRSKNRSKSNSRKRSRSNNRKHSRSNSRKRSRSNSRSSRKRRSSDRNKSRSKSRDSRSWRKNRKAISRDKSDSRSISPRKDSTIEEQSQQQQSDNKNFSDKGKSSDNKLSSNEANDPIENITTSVEIGMEDISRKKLSDLVKSNSQKDDFNDYNKDINHDMNDFETKNYDFKNLDSNTTTKDKPRHDLSNDDDSYNDDNDYFDGKKEELKNKNSETTHLINNKIHQQFARDNVEMNEQFKMNNKDNKYSENVSNITDSEISSSIAFENIPYEDDLKVNKITEIKSDKETINTVMDSIQHSEIINDVKQDYVTEKSSVKLQEVCKEETNPINKQKDLDIHAKISLADVDTINMSNKEKYKDEVKINNEPIHDSNIYDNKITKEIEYNKNSNVKHSENLNKNLNMRDGIDNSEIDMTKQVNKDQRNEVQNNVMQKSLVNTNYDDDDVDDFLNESSSDDQPSLIKSDTVSLSLNDVKSNSNLTVDNASKSGIDLSENVIRDEINKSNNPVEDALSNIQTNVTEIKDLKQVHIDESKMEQYDQINMFDEIICKKKAKCDDELNKSDEINKQEESVYFSEVESLQKEDTSLNFSVHEKMDTSSYYSADDSNTQLSQILSQSQGNESMNNSLNDSFKDDASLNSSQVSGQEESYKRSKRTRKAKSPPKDLGSQDSACSKRSLRSRGKAAEVVETPTPPTRKRK